MHSGLTEKIVLVSDTGGYRASAISAKVAVEDHHELHTHNANRQSTVEHKWVHLWQVAVGKDKLKVGVVVDDEKLNRLAAVVEH